MDRYTWKVSSLVELGTKVVSKRFDNYCDISKCLNGIVPHTLISQIEKCHIHNCMDLALDWYAFEFCEDTKFCYACKDIHKMRPHSTYMRLQRDVWKQKMKNYICAVCGKTCYKYEPIYGCQCHLACECKPACMFKVK